MRRARIRRMKDIAGKVAFITGGASGMGLGMALPRVSTNSIAGLLETLAAPPYNGRADLPHLAQLWPPRLACDRTKDPLAAQCSPGRPPRRAAPHITAALA